MNRRGFLGALLGGAAAFLGLKKPRRILDVVNEGINPDWDGTVRGHLIPDEEMRRMRSMLVHGRQIEDDRLYSMEVRRGPGYVQYLQVEPFMYPRWNGDSL